MALWSPPKSHQNSPAPGPQGLEGLGEEKLVAPQARECAGEGWSFARVLCGSASPHPGAPSCCPSWGGGWGDGCAQLPSEGRVCIQSLGARARLQESFLEARGSSIGRWRVLKDILWDGPAYDLACEEKVRFLVLCE